MTNAESWENCEELCAFKTYDKDALVGKMSPKLLAKHEASGKAILDFVQGEPTEVSTSKTTVIVFWAKFLKDNCFPMMKGIDALVKAHPDDLQAVCVSIDPKRKDIERFVEKGQCPVDLPLAFDEAARFKKTVMALAEWDAGEMQVPQAIIVDKNTQIVWRCAFSKAFRYENSRFEEQLKNVIEGKALYSHGPAPLAADISSEETESFAPPPKDPDDIW
jgi:hypothetical protein